MQGHSIQFAPIVLPMIFAVFPEWLNCSGFNSRFGRERCPQRSDSPQTNNEIFFFGTMWASYPTNWNLTPSVTASPCHLPRRRRLIKQSDFAEQYQSVTGDPSATVLLMISAYFVVRSISKNSVGAHFCVTKTVDMSFFSK